MAGKTGGVPSKGSKQNHMVAPKAAEKDHGPVKTVGDGSNKGGHHHAGHPHANHRATGHHEMGKTVPSFHEAKNAEWEAEARATRHASKEEAAIAGAVKD